MMKELKTSFVNFYKECDKPTFFFTLAVVNQVVGFMPSIPSTFYYVIVIAYALYCLRAHFSINLLLGAFLIYVPFEILITHPDVAFRSWERYLLFGLILIVTSPLIQGDRNIIYRSKIFQMILIACAILGIGSFVGRFLGINYGSLGRTENTMGVGLFGGLTRHSMLLGPIAGIGSLYMIYLWYQTKKRICLLWGILCLASVMFSASRSALIATIAANVVMLYRMSGTGSRFLKIMVALVLVGSVTFPLWSGALDDVMAKQNANVASGGTFESRSDKWKVRIEEFKSNPAFGVGFAAIDLSNAKAHGDSNLDTGVVESGSSWLCILSMTGILGALCLIPIFLNAIMTAWRSCSVFSSVIVGMLVLFYVHMIAEGYVLAGGSFMSFCLWLTIGVGYDSRYYVDEEL